MLRLYSFVPIPPVLPDEDPVPVVFWPVVPAPGDVPVLPELSFPEPVSPVSPIFDGGGVITGPGVVF